MADQSEAVPRAAALNVNLDNVSEDQSDGKTNSKNIRCIHCNCLLLRNKIARLVLIGNDSTNPPEEVVESRKAFTLPTMNASRDAASEQVEDITRWWQIDDIYAFENMGFSKDVLNASSEGSGGGDEQSDDSAAMHQRPQLKYLVCADCERGPLGVHFSKSKKSFLAVDRVNYDDSD